MITKRLAGALIAGSIAIGLTLGAAGTIVAKDTTSASTTAVCADHMADMTSMMSGANGMMSGQGGGPAASAMPDGMQQHHDTQSLAPTR